MKRVCIVAVITAAAAGLALALPAANRAEEKNKVEEELLKLERQWSDALVKRDIETIARIEAEEYILIDPEGTVLDKKKDLETTKVSDFESIGLDDTRVRVYGNAAVVTLKAMIKGKIQGEDISGNYRFTDVFVRRERRWQCVASQGTRIAKE